MKNKFNWLLVLFWSFLLSQGCATVPVDLSKMGDGLHATRNVLKAQTEQVKGNIANNCETLNKMEELDSAIPQDFKDTMIECNKIFSHFERTANTLRWTTFSLAMIGTIAGAVVVPALTAGAAAANKVAIAAFGGLSGATNSAQGILREQGLTAEETVKVREQLRTEFKDAMNDYFDPTSDRCRRLMALRKVAAVCVSYAVQSTSTAVQNGQK